VESGSEQFSFYRLIPEYQDNRGFFILICHFAGEITFSIRQRLAIFFTEFLVLFLLRNDKLNEKILMKMIALAPIGVEILLCNGMEQKIEADSGISS
jgi:hypothetical protein